MPARAPLVLGRGPARGGLAATVMVIARPTSPATSSAAVGELQEALGAPQQNVSKHLGILHSAGMIAREKRGTSVVYSISDPGVFDLCDQVAAVLGASCASSTRCCRPAERSGHAHAGPRCCRAAGPRSRSERCS